MTLPEIQTNLLDIIQINFITDVSEYKYSDTLKFLQIDDYIIHKIELINQSFDSSVLNTSIELAGAQIGDLFYLKNQKFNIASLGNFQFYAFLDECELLDIGLPDYVFKHDYLLIHKDYIDEFHIKFSSNSAIWGGFKIAEDVNVMSYYKKEIDRITIPSELTTLNLYAQDSIFRALDQKHAFERFLKLYHLLELEFDYVLIEKIKSLDIAVDSNLIGSLLNEYNRSEVDRLLDLISNRCIDINNLALKLNNIKLFKSLGEEIFIKFGKGKTANMFLVDSICYNDLLNDPDAFINPSSVDTFAKVRPVNYNKFIHSVAAYWIYRIRCSIAHFKIGEYILTRDKEDFIVEFAEPLINEILIQFYRK